MMAHTPSTNRHQTYALLHEMEASGRIPSSSKFRMMPCQTFISCGMCPYFNKCVFLHDNRVKSSNRNTMLARATPQNHSVKDTFYWPDMDQQLVMQKKDCKQLPSNDQHYDFPIVSPAYRAKVRQSGVITMHDYGVYSLWRHFVLFFDEKENQQQMLTNSEYNIFTGRKRLSIFVELAQKNQEKMKTRAYHIEDHLVIDKDYDVYFPCNNMKITRAHQEFTCHKEKNLDISPISWGSF